MRELVSVSVRQKGYPQAEGQGTEGPYCVPMTLSGSVRRLHIHTPGPQSQPGIPGSPFLYSVPTLPSVRKLSAKCTLKEQFLKLICKEYISGHIWNWEAVNCRITQRNEKLCSILNNSNHGDGHESC